MLQGTTNRYSLTERDINVHRQPAVELTGLTIATSLHGGVQEICANQTTKAACNAHSECEWSSGDCNDSGTGDWDQ